MRRIDDLFTVHRARSGISSEYESGPIPFIGNGFGDNAVMAFVTPREQDKVFSFTGIAVSAFCEATVQAPPFVANGRAGNGLLVLEPKTPMSSGQLAYIAAYVNSALRWKFSWYWQTTRDRVSRLLIPERLPNLDFDVQGAMPTAIAIPRAKCAIKLERVPLGSIYDLTPGDTHSAAELESGNIPLVSCGNTNNGIIGYVTTTEDHIHRHRLTVALNGSPLTTKYHPYDFTAKDDVAVCIPHTPLRLTTELFIQAMLNQERWRYSYYRKCYIDKLGRETIALPIKKSGLDEDAIQSFVEAAPYWKYIQSHLPV